MEGIECSPISEKCGIATNNEVLADFLPRYANTVSVDINVRYIVPCTQSLIDRLTGEDVRKSDTMMVAKDTLRGGCDE